MSDTASIYINYRQKFTIPNHSKKFETIPYSVNKDTNISAKMLDKILYKSSFMRDCEIENSFDSIWVFPISIRLEKSLPQTGLTRKAYLTRRLPTSSQTRLESIPSLVKCVFSQCMQMMDNFGQ